MAYDPDIDSNYFSNDPDEVKEQNRRLLLVILCIIWLPAATVVTIGTIYAYRVTTAWWCVKTGWLC